MAEAWLTEEDEALLSASITDEQLAVLSGTTDLSTATFLQMTVDSVRRPARAERGGRSREYAASRALGAAAPAARSPLTPPQAQVPLGTLGERMPNLQQLKLSGSALPSIRELGTSLCNLQVLWLCRCVGWAAPHRALIGGTDRTGKWQGVWKRKWSEAPALRAKVHSSPPGAA